MIFSSLLLYPESHNVGTVISVQKRLTLGIDLTGMDILHSSTSLLIQQTMEIRQVP